MDPFVTISDEVFAQPIPYDKNISKSDLEVMKCWELYVDWVSRDKYLIFVMIFEIISDKSQRGCVLSQ